MPSYVKQTCLNATNPHCPMYYGQMHFDSVARLNAGVQTWNKWRVDNPAAVVDFRGAVFSGKDFSGADLHHADLRDAILHGTNLRGALLASARLSAADLSGASFDLADLTLADARGAYFIYSTARQANMRQINLNGANLTGADLQEADLHSAILLETVLVDANLCGTRGLEKCDHPGPSIIDHRTVVRSKALPQAFLRGCGLPDQLIMSYSSLGAGAISCFLSYSSKDDAFVRRLHSALQERGVRCWFAPEDLPIGGKIRPTIDREISRRDRFLIVLSRDSINSSWVEKEVETAFERMYRQRSVFLIPIRIDDAVMNTDEAWAADLRRSLNIGDFKDWEDPTNFDRALTRLLRDLNVPE
jgi:uncharacterized protein YjbI with pentapeptide repeats